MNLHLRTLLSMRHIKNESMTLKPIYEPKIHATPTDMFELNGLNGHFRNDANTSIRWVCLVSPVCLCTKDRKKQVPFSMAYIRGSSCDKKIIILFREK